jgi:uncharacterized membrane protein
MMPPLILRRTVLAAGLALGGLFAQTAAARCAMVSDTGLPRANPQPGDVSLTHSAEKAMTFNIAVVLSNFVTFSAGTGSLIGGGILTAVNVTKSLLLYTANDYAWDTYFPVETSQEENKEFDATQSVWRTTEKFLTYKPISVAIKFASIFLYTGSIPVMIIYGTASESASTGIFFLNNFAWDAYDWSWAVSQEENDEALGRPPPIRLDRPRPDVSR